MIVLGITDSMTSGASLVSDGRVLAAVSEERLTRQKMAMGFPNHSIEAVLRISSLTMKDVGHVTVATNNLFWRPYAGAYVDYFRQSKGSDRDLFLIAGSVAARISNGSPVLRQAYYGLKSKATSGRRKEIPKRLKEVWGYTGDISFVEHHLCHCASAYFTSGMDDALAISLDGAGDFCSSHIYKVTNGNFKKVNEIDSYDSIGNYYSYVTHICGFQAHKHEGKITGLAAYGNPERYIGLFRKLIRYENGSIKNTGGCFDKSAIDLITKEIGSDYSMEDLSAAAQHILEEISCSYVDYWVKKTGISKVALAGGVFANVKLNQRILELDSVKSVFIHPGMGDEGLATGAALYKSFGLSRNNGFRKEGIDNVFWGAEYSSEDIEREINAVGLTYRRYDDIEKESAKLLSEGKVIARFSGRMEYGPRALGNRSILFQATDKTVNDWLNKRLKRTEFMPFAPVTMEEYADKCYKLKDKRAAQADRFMTITYDCTEWMKKTCPAVVHVDGTARPQIINKKENPGYYKILDEYRKLTGIPSLINTSFNMHEEPIVESPGDAIRAFQKGDLDYLAMGKFLVMNN